MERGKGYGRREIKEMGERGNEEELRGMVWCSCFQMNSGSVPALFLQCDAAPLLDIQTIGLSVMRHYDTDSFIMILIF